MYGRLTVTVYYVHGILRTTEFCSPPRKNAGSNGLNLPPLAKAPHVESSIILSSQMKSIVTFRPTVCYKRFPNSNLRNVAVSNVRCAKFHVSILHDVGYSSEVQCDLKRKVHSQLLN